MGRRPGGYIVPREYTLCILQAMIRQKRPSWIPPQRKEWTRWQVRLLHMPPWRKRLLLIHREWPSRRNRFLRFLSGPFLDTARREYDAALSAQMKLEREVIPQVFEELYGHLLEVD